MKNGKDRMEEKLTTYFRGGLSRRERDEVIAWYGESEQNARILELTYLAHRLSLGVSAFETIDTDRAYADFRRRADSSSARKLKLKRAKLRKRIWQSVAAAVFAGAVAFASVTFTDTVHRVESPVAVRTGIGERAQVELPDGSQVWLNSCSELSYQPSVFSSGRGVRMTGEAYFEVKHDDRSPFVVNGLGVEVEVLGTRFNLNANSDEPSVTATLLEGSIRVRYGLMEQSVTLRPNQRIVVDRANGFYRLSDDPNATESTGWMSGKLHFENMKLVEIAAKLEKHYNIEIVFRDEKIGNERFSSDFSTADNIERILSLFAKTETVGYRIIGRRVEIYDKNKP